MGKGLEEKKLSYELVVKFSSVKELVEKLRLLLSELEEQLAVGEREGKPIKVLCDETIRRLGERLLMLSSSPLEVYEASSSISSEVTIRGVKYVPVQEDLDILRKAQELGAILITGDKRLARTAEAQGVKVIYIPPSGVASADHYAMEVLKRLEEKLSRGSKP